MIPFPGAKVRKGLRRRDIVDRARRTGLVIETIVPQVNLQPEFGRRPIHRSVNQNAAFIPAEGLVLDAKDEILIVHFSPKPGGVRRSAGR